MIKSLACVLISSSVCFGQTATVTPTENFVDNISICDTFTLVNYKAGELPNSDTTLFQLVQGVNYKINDSFTASLDIPVYIDDNTDLGSIGLDLIWNAWKNDSISFAFNVGVNSPMETDFGASSVDPTLGGVVTYVCPLGDKFNVGATVWQNYTVSDNGQQNILMGPNAQWNITDNVNLNGSVAIPVYQNVNASAEQNYVMSASLSIKF